MTFEAELPKGHCYRESRSLSLPTAMGSSSPAAGFLALIFLVMSILPFAVRLTIKRATLLEI